MSEQLHKILRIYDLFVYEEETHEKYQYDFTDIAMGIFVSWVLIPIVIGKKLWRKLN